MPRKQLNIRLDDLTRATIKRIGERWNMSESQVITRAVFLLEQQLNVATSVADLPRSAQAPQQDETNDDR